MKYRYPFGRTKHVCGIELIQCSHCESAFCPSCDCFNSSIKICCKDAMDAFFRQEHRRHDYAPIKKTKKGKIPKVKVEIEEYGDGNL